MYKSSLQHLFSTRIDPMFDGLDNSVCEVDVVPSDAPTGSEDVGHRIKTLKNLNLASDIR